VQLNRNQALLGAVADRRGPFRLRECRHLGRDAADPDRPSTVSDMLRRLNHGDSGFLAVFSLSNTRELREPSGVGHSFPWSLDLVGFPRPILVRFAALLWSADLLGRFRGGLGLRISNKVLCV
jgi:hypothetical protein